MSLGKNIQYLRKQKKITQEQFAEMMSVSRQTISRWESDKIIPELSKLITLSELFSCKLGFSICFTVTAKQIWFERLYIRLCVTRRI